LVQWCLYVYSSVCHFWWKLIDRNFFNPIFNTKDCICLFYFQVGWGGGGVVWGWLYLINSLPKKTTKNIDSHPAVLLTSFKFCAPVVKISLKYLFPEKCSSKYVVKNARNVTQFVWQHFSIEFQGFVQKKIK
jgi:hypothetical protein